MSTGGTFREEDFPGMEYRVGPREYFWGEKDGTGLREICRVDGVGSDEASWRVDEDGVDRARLGVCCVDGAGFNDVSCLEDDD